MLDGGNALPEARPSPAPDPEALIAEARQRQRRRRLVVMLAFAAVGAIAVAGAWLWQTGSTSTSSPESRTATPFSAGAPVIVFARGHIQRSRGFIVGSTINPWVWRSEPDGSDPTRLAPGTDPVLSPNGRLVAFTRDSKRGRGQTFVIPVTGGTARKLSAPTDLEYAWAPDSKSLVGSRGTGGQFYTVNVATGQATRRQRDCRVQASGSTVETSPTSAGVILECGQTFVSYNPASSRTAPIAPGVRIAGHPLVLGSRWVAFSRVSPDNSLNIWLVRPDGTDLHRLTHGQGAGLMPVAWTPDGQTLLAVNASLHTADTWVIDARSGQVQVRLPGLSPIGLSKDGTTILGSKGCHDVFSTARILLSAPLAGGQARRIATGTCWASWNA